MKIVILSDGIPPEGKGGAERIAWQSALALSKAGHEVSVLTTTRSSSTIETEVQGIRIFSIPSSYHVRWRAWRSIYNPGPVREVKQILNELRPDIVHAHNVHQHLSYASLGVARAAGARVLHTVHDAMPFNYDKLANFVDVKNPICAEHPNYKVSAWKHFREQRLRYNPLRNLLIRRALRNVDTLITVSHALSDALAQNGIPGARVIYNGIAAEEWTISADAVKEFIHRQELEGKKVILFGGRITGTKGGDALLSALPQIVAAGSEAVLLIIGTENDYVRKLLSRADAAGLSQNVRVTGWIAGDELRAAYHAADMVVVPSIYLDPLPTVVLEAMACGKPVVGSCLGGIPEMVQDGVTGSIVHPLRTKDLADACTTLLSDADQRDAYGAAGAQRQREQFSEQRHVDALLAAYEKVPESRA